MIEQRSTAKQVRQCAHAVHAGHQCIQDLTRIGQIDVPLAAGLLRCLRHERVGDRQQGGAADHEQAPVQQREPPPHGGLRRPQAGDTGAQRHASLPIR